MPGVEAGWEARQLLPLTEAVLCPQLPASRMPVLKVGQHKHPCKTQRMVFEQSKGSAQVQDRWSTQAHLLVTPG